MPRHVGTMAQLSTDPILAIAALRSQRHRLGVGIALKTLIMLRYIKV